MSKNVRRTASYPSLALLATGLLPLPALWAQQLPDDGDVRLVRTWAAPGLLRNPVAFSMDWAGNAYVAESDRAGGAVSDTRQLTHLNGVEEDLLLRTVEDRRELIRKWVERGAFPPDHFTATEDRVRMVRDTDGDGVADLSSVFAGGFSDEVEGIGAGTLWRDGDVYYTCIPNLWRLRDDDGDGVADSRESLSYGYGVRWCFYGHDLHGLVNGPDGRIYFSVGDRGFNVTTKEGERLVGPDRGAVFRCWPDGTGLELFHVGLRNPQELAFDEFGNLFTGDNNCDSGDLARVVYVMEGGDSGWRQNVQSLPSRGPWNREHIWEIPGDARDPSRPAWALPPIDHVGAGPSGLAYYPGTGESHRYDDTFFMVDFYGSGATVHSFRAAPSGAGFRLTERHEYYKGTTVTDIAWGPDSRLYLTDWGEGWGPNEKGNIFTITNESVRGDSRGEEAITDVRALLGAGVAGRGETELLALLAHRDQRVRLAAQYELAARGPGAGPALLGIARDERSPILQRVHSVWCLGQIARATPGAADGVAELLDSPDAEMRRQAVRTLGDLRAGEPGRFAAALEDTAPEVRAEAAIALGKAGDGAEVPALLGALDANGDRDPFLRHALVHGLELMAEPDAVIDGVAGRGRSARVGAVLALRRLGHGGVAQFLNDPDPGVAIEAARAVYDLSLGEALPALARKLDRSPEPAVMVEPFMRRAIEANVLLGEPENAERLARLATDAAVPEEWRALALRRLAAWDAPLPREGVWGDWVDLPARPMDDARRPVLAHLESIRAASGAGGELAGLADTLGAKYSLDLDLARALAHLTDPQREEAYRLALLDQIAAREPGALPDACAAVLDAGVEATTPALRMLARDLLRRLDPVRVLPLLEEAVTGATLAERQHAVQSIGSIDSQTSRDVIAGLATGLRGGELDPAIALEVFLAAQAASDPAARAAADEVLAGEPRRAPGMQTALLVRGGDAARGLDLFRHHEVVQCVRCHSVSGRGGTAGPDLTAVASRAGRAQLVQSLLEPGAVVAAGYGTASAMPPMGLLLEPAQVRDLVAYLATLVDPGVGPAPDPPTVGAPGASDARGAPPPADAHPSGGRHVSWRVALWSATPYVLVLLPVGVWLLLRAAGRRG